MSTTPPTLASQTPSNPWTVLWLRLRRGDSGMIPIVLGLIALCVYFEARSSSFLTAGNLNNLSIQATGYVLLGMAEIWLLLLGEIDLSLGFLAGLSGAAAVILTDLQFHWPWFAGIAMALVVGTIVGLFSGLLVIVLRLPSFIVTLAIQLALLGILIWVVDSQGTGGTISITNGVLHGIVYGHLSILWTDVFIGLTVVGLVAQSFARNKNRRSRELDTTPTPFLLILAVLLVAAGITAAWIFNTNRGYFTLKIQGMPYAIVILGVMVAGSTFFLNRTKAGRYLYAIGGNQEAARRAGIQVNRYRILAFALAGFTSGVAGLVYVSNLNGINDAVPGGTQVLYAVGAAVIGGTSLFGGRGKMVHALVGGVVIGVIYNGMALLSISVYGQYLATAGVFLVAVTIDNVARRGSTVSR